MLYIPTSFPEATIKPVTNIVTGQYLAKNRLNARDRAKLAANIVAGKVMIDTSTLTVRQITKLARANRAYVDEVRFPDQVKRRQQKKLAVVFDAIGPEARAEACRTIGIERVWDAICSAL